ncbi:16S rRNA (cytosine(1402)-N(4))-methyltransferase, partial [Gemmatimonadota bacterium]
AADLLNQEEESELARLFRVYGEEPRARRLARQVARRRRERPLQTSDDLVAALGRALDRTPTPRDKARVFQAVRIALNKELEALADGLPRLRDSLKASGVLVVISYHSLEDRLVKDAVRDWSRECVCPPGLPICSCPGRALGTSLTRKPLRPEREEVHRNPRARSALLRAWRKAA